METKICFKCKRELPITNFYRHPQMYDGHLNKCKDCTKKDVSSNYFRNIENEDYIEKERQRGREKYHRLYSSLKKKSSHNENKNTRRFLRTKGINCSGMEIHHWDYNLKNDIFLLSPRNHKKIHSLLLFDKESKKFIYKNEIIETKEKHYKIIREILGDDAEIIEVNF
ncbi:MAG: hypothetical protein ACI4N3_04415 [Alphaproteobacteria bacterium]